MLYQTQSTCTLSLGIKDTKGGRGGASGNANQGNRKRAGRGNVDMITSVILL